MKTHYFYPLAFLLLFLNTTALEAQWRTRIDLTGNLIEWRSRQPNLTVQALISNQLAVRLSESFSFTTLDLDNTSNLLTGSSTTGELLIFPFGKPHQISLFGGRRRKLANCYRKAGFKGSRRQQSWNPGQCQNSLEKILALFKGVYIAPGYQYNHFALKTKLFTGGDTTHYHHKVLGKGGIFTAGYQLRFSIFSFDASYRVGISGVEVRGPIQELKETLTPETLLPLTLANGFRLSAGIHF